MQKRREEGWVAVGAAEEGKCNQIPDGPLGCEEATQNQALGFTDQWWGEHQRGSCLRTRRVELRFTEEGSLAARAGAWGVGESRASGPTELPFRLSEC